MRLRLDERNSFFTKKNLFCFIIIFAFGKCVSAWVRGCVQTKERENKTRWVIREWGRVWKKIILGSRGDVVRRNDKKRMIESVRWYEKRMLGYWINCACAKKNQASRGTVFHVLLWSTDLVAKRLLRERFSRLFAIIKFTDINVFIYLNK